MRCMYNVRFQRFLNEMILRLEIYFQHTGTYGVVTTGTHTTWDFGYIDDIDFMYTDIPSGCSINVNLAYKVYSGHTCSS